MSRIKLLLNLFFSFSKIGFFTFGGGYAMIAMIEDICVRRKNWITHDEMMNVTIIAESTPGPIAINCATYTGYRQAGFAGALAATLGIIVPSFAVICLVAIFFDNFLKIAVVANAFKGIKIAVGILIADAALTMIKKMPKKRLPLAIMGVSAAAMIISMLFKWKVSSITLMLIAGAASVIIFLLNGAPEKKKGEEK